MILGDDAKGKHLLDLDSRLGFLLVALHISTAEWDADVRQTRAAAGWLITLYIRGDPPEECQQ